VTGAGVRRHRAGVRRHRARIALLASVAAASVGSGCGRAVAPLVVPRQSAVALTGGSNTSMIYLARTTDGVLAIDLGWWGQERTLARALASLGATPADVRWVFLTHSHRDHIAAWPAMRHARVYVGGAEQPLLVGAGGHGGWIPRLAERLAPSRLPGPGDLELHGIGQDTTLLLGADTLRAYPVAGHTPGSIVYLFRGVLFLGDAVTWSRWGGFAPAKRGFSADSRAAGRELARLWPRLPPGAVHYACTAHAHCAPFATLMHDVGKPDCGSSSGEPHSPKRTRRVSSSSPVRRVSDSYSSGRRARSQRRPDDVGSSDASRSATTIASPSARVSAMISP
jgi:glyoxylase-like metal-dependent hydrolase (beta-lactamase superfamily II)